MKYTSCATLSTDEVFHLLDTSLKGIPEARVAQLQLEHGRNELRLHQLRWWQVFGRQFKSPFIYLLVAAAVIALSMGEHIDAIMIAVFIMVNSLLGFFQEYRSEKTAQLLSKYIVHRATVRRDGVERGIDSAELVPGDIVLLDAGDAVPADIRIIRQLGAQLDESALTGESMPVTKTADIAKRTPQQITQATNVAFSGTTVVGGALEGIVIATGKDMVVGEIARLSVETTRVSAFEIEVSKISKFILRLTLITLAGVFIGHLLLRETDIGNLLIFSIALAVSVIPEALPVVVSFCLAEGASHLSKNHVVVKRLSAIEDLGSIEVLCTDKTGTITENKMSVAEVFGQADEVLRWAVLANAPDVELGDLKNSFDLALARALPKQALHALRAYAHIAAIPFDPKRRKNSALVRDGDTYTLVVRGAPEQIMRASHLNEELRDTAKQWVAQQGSMGRRVIGVATKHMPVCEEYAPDAEDTDVTLRGFISFADPIKKSTAAAIAHAQKLGVQVKIISGDAPEVARAVAQTIKLIGPNDLVLTGDQLEHMHADDQLQAVKKCHVFARISPEQKFQIIQLVQEHALVGFLGEGINDAPALKVAHVALVVHGASAIAQEAADIILLNRSLEVIINGIREGRKIFANTLKYVQTTLASNFGNFFSIAVISLLIPFLPMLPVQILLVNLLSDMPMIAIATDTVNVAELRKPRSYSIRSIALLCITLGVVSSFFDFMYFAIFVRHGAPVLQTNWFIASVLTELIFIYSIRTKLPFWKAQRASWSLIGLTGIAAIATGVIPYLTFGHEVFSFVTPAPGTLVLLLGLVATYFAVTEVVKLIYYRQMNGSAKA